MNKTKEQILKAKFQKPPNGEYNPIHEAMDEYAKQEAMAFAKWIPQNACIAEDEYYFCLLSDGSITTEEKLYELYLQSKTK